MFDEPDVEIARHATRTGTHAIGIVRASLRATTLVGFVAVVYVSWFAGDVVLAGTTERRKAWRRRWVRNFARGVARVTGMRVTVEGRQPEPPFLLVSNHLGYIDIIALSSVVDCVYVARGDLADWPVIGTLCRAAEIIFTDRSRKKDVLATSERIARTLARGDGVVLFAEGTSTEGSSVAPFKPSLLEPAVVHRLPVHYATIGYVTRPGDPPAHMAVCWWGDMTFPDHFMRLLGLRSFDARIVFGDAPICESDRKELARRLHDAVSGQFTPVE